MAHHDLTAIPGGFATPLWNMSGTDAPCSLVEFDDDGMTKTVIADMASVYTSKTFHTNALHYYARDDSYTIGDRNPNLFVKVTRAGELVWQFGGADPVDPSKFFTGVSTWTVNHGHHLLADGTFFFYNNGGGGGPGGGPGGGGGGMTVASTAFLYKLDTTTMTATQLSKFTGLNSMVLGDAQILPNGNFLVTASTSGVIEELDAAGAVVMKISAPSGGGFGYSEFRESLYGPPPY
jgi:hypothetical protein